jgi:hypothetical protein
MARSRLTLAADEFIRRRPATRLPPHPPLRAFRRLVPQGQPRARPPPPDRHRTARCPVAGAARHPSAVSLLRRAHDRHRDVRALARAAGATATSVRRQGGSARDPARLASTLRPQHRRCDQALARACGRQRRSEPSIRPTPLPAMGPSSTHETGRSHPCWFSPSRVATPPGSPESRKTHS